MKSRHPRSVRGALAMLTTLAVVAACGPAPSGPPASTSAPTTAPASPTAGTPGPTVSPTAVPSLQPSSSPTGATVRAYFMLGSFTGDGGLVPVLRTVPATEDLGTAAMAALLAGPNETELGARPAMYTAVPDGTRFTSVTIKGNSATVVTGALFPDNSSASSRQGVAQIVYTLTQFPGIEYVFFRQADFLGPVGHPATRGDFRDLLPPIWVDDPAWGGSLPSGGRVTGLANVFEAQFRLMVLDAAGRTVTDMPVMATCGTGCWGTFDAHVSYRVSLAQLGTLRVFDASAKDGKPEHVVEYPVWLTP